jgi:cobalt-zinc-cadmium efflux system membrane fusion protein
MNRSVIVVASLCVSLGLFIAGCERKVRAQDNVAASTGPSPTVVESDLDANNFKVLHPDQFPLATAGERIAAPELNVTGVVNPDVSRQVPVPSLATGRIVEIGARLGDQVTKGQLLFKVRSADMANAFSNYRQAVKNEELTKIQLDRANLLFEHGAIPKSGQEIAQNAEDDNIVVLETAKEQLGLLGADPGHPTGIVQVFAPVSGTITDQEITDQSAVQSYTAPNPFTISARLDHLRCMGEQYVASALGRVRGHPSGSLSGPGFEGPDQQHLADHRPQHSHHKSSLGS